MQIYKKILIIIFFVCNSTFILPADSQTFFKPKTINSDAVLQNALTTRFINQQKSKNKFTISAKIFYEESTNQNELTKYFFPNNKTELLIAAENASDEIKNQRDIAAEWLQIASDSDREMPYPAHENDYKFSSKIKIDPEFKRFGCTLKLHKRITDNIWIESNFPFIQVETNANLQEYDKQNERTSDKIERDRINTIHNATEAFNNPLMKYGKITNRTQKLAGLADINFKIGYHHKTNSNHTFNIYSSFIFPTGFKPKAEYLFEPIVGNAGHLGLGAGINLDFQIFSNFNFLNTVDYKYLFQNNEKRSFDLLQNGKWSRYLAAANGIIDDRPIPLINFLTKELDITPGSAFNFLSSLHYANKSFHAELGYNFYFQQKEKAQLKLEWQENVGIAYFSNDSLDYFEGTYNKTYSSATIYSSMIIENQTDDFVEITKENLNLDSSIHPQKISNQLYLSFGLQHRNLNLSTGGSYQISSSNTSFSSYKLWIQIHANV